MGVGERYFCRFHIYRDSASAQNAANWLLTSQGRGKDILRAGFDHFFRYGCLFHNRVALWTAGCGDCFLCYRSPGSAAHFILCRRRARSSNHLRLVDGMLAASASLGVMFVGTSLMRAMVTDLHPLTQILICAPVGVLTGIVFISIFQSAAKSGNIPTRDVREFNKNR